MLVNFKETQSANEFRLKANRAIPIPFESDNGIESGICWMLNAKNCSKIV